MSRLPYSGGRADRRGGHPPPPKTAPASPLAGTATREAWGATAHAPRATTRPDHAMGSGASLAPETLRRRNDVRKTPRDASSGSRRAPWRSRSLRRFHDRLWSQPSTSDTLQDPAVPGTHG